MNTLSITFGSLTLTKGGTFTLDAQPHVMQRARRVFQSAKSGGLGKFTHSVLSIEATPDTGKDMAWFANRYPLEIDEATQQMLNTLVERYERALAAAANRQLSLSPSSEAWQIGLPLFPHQATFQTFARRVERTLLADPIGGMKTGSLLSTLVEPDARPALIVCQAHLKTQWLSETHRFLPDARAVVISGTKPHELPECDVVIISYNLLHYWQDTLMPMSFATVGFDEAQELRRHDPPTKKRLVARALSKQAKYCFGLSGTPIYNYGSEIWSVIDTIYPDALGSSYAFMREWCGGTDKVSDVRGLHSFLSSQGLMIRRTPEEMGFTLEQPTKSVITLDADLETLRQMEDVAKALALSVLSNKVGVSAESARELDWRLRHATGVAKAKSVAQFVRMIVGEGEKVLLAGWHRDVYDVWLKDLRDLGIVLYTGTESPAAKEAAKKAFIEGPANVLALSLRSGAGLDGLQHVANTVVFGELDWSPHVMDQVIGRLARPGQTRPVRAFFLTIDDGSDPFMASVVSEKRAQHDGIIEGSDEAAMLLDDAANMDRIREMAKVMLAQMGVEATEGPAVGGLHAEVETALRKLRVPTATEAVMQEALFANLPSLVSGTVTREVRFGERSRLDFLVEGEDLIGTRERIAIECKIDRTGKAAVYRQVRKYVEECGVTGVVLYAPWSGVARFEIDGCPVTVVDWSKAAL